MRLKDIHPARRILRKTLLGLLGLSFLFLGGVIGLRIYYKDRPITGKMQVAVFEADVLKHHTYAYFIGNDAEDMQIAEQLFKLGYVSPIYTRGGMELLRSKAENGYGPAEVRVATLEAQYPYLKK